MRASLLTSVLIASLAMFSCSQYGRMYRRATKNYQKGLYENAVLESVNSLRLRPDNMKAQDLLVQAWNRTVENGEARVAQYMQSQDNGKWDSIYREYKNLDNLASQIRSLPVLVNPNSGYRVFLNIPDFSEKISSSKENAAETHYQSGIRFARMNNDLETQKKAALEFKAAMSLIPDYKDASLKYEQSRKLAVKRLAVQPFEDKSATRNHYGALSELLTDQIISQILNVTAGSEFIEIISRNQMDAVIAEQQLNASGLVSEASTVKLGQILGAHEILTGRILQINQAQERTVSVNQEVKAKVVTGKEKYTDEMGNLKERDVWGEVSCQYRKFTKTAGVNVSGSFSILDVETGKIMLQETIEAKNPWSESWCRKISGDDRALNQSLKTLMNKAEPFPPNESEMAATALREMASAIVSKARSYLN